MMSTTPEQPAHAFDWEGGEDAFPAHDKPLVEDRRTEARIASVQLVAQALLMGTTVAEGRPAFEALQSKRKIEKKLFALLADELQTGAERYTALVKTHLHASWTWERTNVVLRAILMASAAELTAQPTLPTGVVMEEYMNIAKGFLPAEEVSFTRASLEKLVSAIRP